MKRLSPACTGLLVFLAAASAAAQELPKVREEPVPMAERQRLRELLDVVEHADRVEALPVREEGAGLSATHHLVERPVAVDAATGRSLRRLVAGYDWTSGSMACIFQPGVAFRFRRGNEATVVQVCFMCGEMALDGIEGPFGRKKALMPKERKTLLEAARKAFPKEFDGFDR